MNLIKGEDDLIIETVERAVSEHLISVDDIVRSVDVLAVLSDHGVTMDGLLAVFAAHALRDHTPYREKLSELGFRVPPVVVMNGNPGRIPSDG